MDRMRDRLDKMARRSMSAPASSGAAADSSSRLPARAAPSRQAKVPLPRTPGGVPSRPLGRAASTTGQTSQPSGKRASAPTRNGKGSSTISNGAARVRSSQPQSQPAPADARETEPLAAPADVLDGERILELPPRATAAARQRPQRPHIEHIETADVVPVTPAATEARTATARASTPSRRRSASPLPQDHGEDMSMPASQRGGADQRAGGDGALPENVEPVGGAMQRFLTVLAERRRQRASGNGDGGEPPRRSEPSDVCPICGGAGYVRLDVPVGDPGFGQPVPCACKEREFEERRRLEEERRILELDRFFSLKPFGDKTFKTFNPRVAGVKEAYEAARTFAEDPTGSPYRWLVLMGGTGVGKTHLAAAIAHTRLAARSSVFFAVVPDLLDHLRAAFAPSAEMPYNEMFETVREVEMLILDDLGSENSTAWATEKLFQIINYRYNYRMPTVITTNSRLFEHMDERIASRLSDTNLSRTVVIEASSRRPRASRQAPPPRW